jgi:hypothetical protein
VTACQPSAAVTQVPRRFTLLALSRSTQGGGYRRRCVCNKPFYFLENTLDILDTPDNGILRAFTPLKSPIEAISRVQGGPGHPGQTLDRPHTSQARVRRQRRGGARIIARGPPIITSEVFVVASRARGGGYEAAQAVSARAETLIVFSRGRDTWQAEMEKCGARSKAQMAQMATYGGRVGRRGSNSIDFHYTF